MWRKKLRIRKLQSVLIIIIIMFSSLILSTATGIIISLDKPIDELAKQCDAPVMKVYPYDQREVENIKDKMEKIKGVDKINMLNIHEVKEKASFKDKEIEYNLFLVKYDKDIFKDHIKFITEKTDDLKDDECFISQGICSSVGIKKGDDITIDMGEKKIQYKVKGIYTDPYATNLMAVNDVLVGKIDSKLSLMKSLYVEGDKNTTAEQIINDYKSNNDKILNASVQTRDEYLSEGQLPMHTMGGILTGISCMFLIVSVLMIRFMIKSAVINDKMTISVYKSIGYSCKYIISIYMKLYMSLIAISSVIGAILSKMLIKHILEPNFKQIGVSNYSGGYYMQIASVLLIIIVSALTCYRTLKFIHKVSPVEVFNGEELSSTSSKKKKNSSAFSNLGFSSLGIALRNILRDKKNTLYIIITCFSTIFIMNFGYQSLKKVYTMRQDNDYWFGIDKSDLVLKSSNDDKYEDMLSALEKDSKVEKVVEQKTQFSNIAWKKGITNTDIALRIYDDYKDLSMDRAISKGRNPESAKEIGISVNVAKEAEKDVGDYIEVYINNKKVSFLITCIYQSYYDLGHECRVLKSAFTENNEDIKYDEISIYLKNKDDTEKFMEEYNDKFAGSGKIIKRTDKYSVIMDEICNPQKKAILPIGCMIILLGAINIFSIVSLKNLKNYKTNCIYKSIGYNSFHLIKSNVIYVSLIGVISLITAVPIVLMTYSKIMTLCLSFFGINQYPVDLNVKEILLYNLLLLLLYVLSAVLSSVKILKASATDLNRE